MIKIRGRDLPVSPSVLVGVSNGDCGGLGFAEEGEEDLELAGGEAFLEVRTIF